MSAPRRAAPSPQPHVDAGRAIASAPLGVEQVFGCRLTPAERRAAELLLANASEVWSGERNTNFGTTVSRLRRKMQPGWGLYVQSRYVLRRR